MSRYLVKLKPLDWYFFGGEKTFGDDNKAEYLAKSNLLPQQTAILGMLRYQLLTQAKWLIGDKNRSNAKQTDIDDLIGPSSFSIQNKTASFGKISKISPICICRTDKDTNADKFYVPVPLDNGYDVKFADCDNVSLNGQNPNVVVDVKSFDHKKYENYEKWGASVQDIISVDDIFETKSQIGITKQTGSQEDKCFYKQEVCRLKDSFEFAFWVDIDGKLDSDKVFLGAQRSCFAMTVEVKDEVFSPFSTASNGRIVLLSNTYVENLDGLKNLCQFMWSDSIPFRNMETVANGKYKSGHVSYNKQDVCFNFLKAGSVLYFDENNGQEIEKLLNQKYLQYIGYNHFK